jgi:trehalose 6-phosphate phosphatase
MPTRSELEKALQPLIEAPERAAILCDVDGTIAPIVERAELADVSDRTSHLLGALGRRYAVVACVSGRGAGDVRALVGVDGIDYAGSHGAEVLLAGAHESEWMPELEQHADRVRRFADELDGSDLSNLGVRLEDKGPIFAFHWRGASDENAARERVEQVAGAAEAEGLWTHWGRKVLEVRPPVAIDKGRAVRLLLEGREVTAALYAGDDRTDLDGFEALAGLAAESGLEAAVRVGVASDEGPPEIVAQADLAVEGVSGFIDVLAVLAGEP